MEGKRKSRSKRKIYVRVPSGKVNIQFRKRKPAKAQCAECGAILKGVARVRANRLHRISKSEKRPSRPFGGVLCTRCMRRQIIRNIKE